MSLSALGRNKERLDNAAEALVEAFEAKVSAGRPPLEDGPIVAPGRVPGLLRVLNVLDLCQEPIPKPQPILAPWLLRQGLTMLYAWRGVGKTHAALGIAHAVASGETFLGWKAPQPRRVLYLDGEMPASAMQERLQAMMATSEADFDPENLRILTPDLQDRPMPDLATVEGQALIDSIRDGAELIVVDNLSTLARETGANENDSDSWRGVQAWALRQRQQGVAVLFVHHSGKGGAQRGTSKREDVLDAVLELKRPGDYQEEQGARFEVHFRKARHFHGPEANPFEASLAIDEKGVRTWATKSLEDSTFEQVISLSHDGLQQNDIAEELGLNKSTISRHLKRAREQGRIPAIRKP
jgi:DNA-binding transcriptional ArsR family regulator